PAAHLEGAPQSGSNTTKSQRLVFGKPPTPGRGQRPAKHRQGGAGSENTGAKGILELPAPACTTDHFSDRLRIKGVDTSRLAQFGLLYRRAAIDGATAAGAGIEHLFPTCPVVVTARRVALHGVDGALRRRATDDLGSALDP